MVCNVYSAICDVSIVCFTPYDRERATSALQTHRNTLTMILFDIYTSRAEYRTHNSSDPFCVELITRESSG